MTKPQVKYLEYQGMTYQEAWDLQTDCHNELKQNKVDWRGLAEEDRKSKRQLHKLIFCEHGHVYTLGKSGSIDHLLLTEEQLAAQQVEYFKINRGGDITYHGPGQITGYPIFDMDEFYNDIHLYVRMLEECVIKLLSFYGIKGDRIDGFTGVWIRSTAEGHPHRKLCAIGVHMSRWVTLHGFALNVNTDLQYFENIIPCGIDDKDKAVTSMQQELGRKVDMEEYFENIIPCGIDDKDKAVTSMQQELGRKVDMEEVKDKLKAIFAVEFGFEFKE
eukprot:maker-scaffold891_size84600-snap-gene-0.1 protein:Tk05773 transcript:maker-scaffold891_size84600-snap-gene-0.1-mRNA-1 annotation:"octanoyltransferase"